MALVVKNLPASAGDVRDMGSIPVGKIPLKEGLAVHSIVLAWEIPWTENHVGCSPWSCTELDMIEGT